MTAVALEHPAVSRQRLQQRLSGLIERLIEVMDSLDVDPDLEDGADDEPSLSASLPRMSWEGSQDAWLQGPDDDREDACVKMRARSTTDASRRTAYDRRQRQPSDPRGR